MPPANSKGKGKAIERTPLLDGDGNPVGDNPGEDQPFQPAARSQSAATSRPSIRRAWRSHALTAALVLLTLLFGILLGIILLTESYAAPAWHNINSALSHSGRNGDKFWEEAVLLRGPDAVTIISVDRRKDEMGVVLLEVKMSAMMRIAVDTDFIMGFREDGTQDDGWWRSKWKGLGRWGVRQLGSTTAVVDDITIYPSLPSVSEPLVTFTPLSPIAIPLNPGLTAQDHYSPPPSLISMSIPLIICPSQNASLLIKFFKQSWAQGFFSVRIHGSSVLVYGGHECNNPPKWWELTRWRNWLKLRKDEVMLDVNLPIPPLRIPSHPPSRPGSELPDLIDLLILESFNITSAPSPPDSPHPFPTSTTQVSPVDPRSANIDAFRDQNSLEHQKVPSPSTDVVPSSKSYYSSAGWNLLISARASLAHPFSTLAPKLDVGRGLHSLPFVVALPVSPERNHTSTASPLGGRNGGEIIPVAKVYASPTFNSTHIHISLSGYVLPLSNSSSQLADAISAFVSSYLSYKPSSIAIFSPFYPSMVVHVLFPPPPDKLELLRDVEIENMSIHPGIGSIYLPHPDRDATAPSVDTAFTALEILASATVHARVVLPPGMNIDIRVARVWIDCFVFDGEVPPALTSGAPASTADEDGIAPPSGAGDPPVPAPRPLPTPLPARAFARITPKNWLNATSSSVPAKRQSTGHTRQNGTAGDGGGEAGTNVYVTAELVDVPLEVLPGRQGDLSSFVTKVLFSKDPVVAGIRGVAAVGVGVPGLTAPASSGPRVEGRELILTGLPFEGNVRVGGRKF